MGDGAEAESLPRLVNEQRLLRLNLATGEPGRVRRVNPIRRVATTAPFRYFERGHAVWLVPGRRHRFERGLRGYRGAHAG